VTSCETFSSSVIRATRSLTRCRTAASNPYKPGLCRLLPNDKGRPSAQQTANQSDQVFVRILLGTAVDCARHPNLCASIKTTLLRSTFYSCNRCRVLPMACAEREYAERFDRKRRSIAPLTYTLEGPVAAFLPARRATYLYTELRNEQRTPRNPSDRRNGEVSIGTVDRALHGRGGIKDAPSAHLQIAGRSATRESRARALSVTKRVRELRVHSSRIHFFYDSYGAAYWKRAAPRATGNQFVNAVRTLGEDDTGAFKG